jgi:hypothetical protein
LSRQLAIVCQDGAGLVYEMAATGLERHTVTIEGLLLPLLHTGTSIARLIGSKAVFDPPAWLGTEPLAKCELLSHRLIWPARDAEGRTVSKGEALRPIMPVLSDLAGARLVKIDRRSFRVLDGGRTGPHIDD